MRKIRDHTREQGARKEGKWRSVIQLCLRLAVCRLQKGSVSSVVYVKHVVLISTTRSYFAPKSVSISRLSSDACMG